MKIISLTLAALFFSLSIEAKDHSTFFSVFVGCWETIEWNGQPAPTNDSTDPRFKNLSIANARYVTDQSGREIPTIQGFLFQTLGELPQFPGTVGYLYDYVVVYLDRGDVRVLPFDFNGPPKVSIIYSFEGILKERTSGADFLMRLHSTWTMIDLNTLVISENREIPDGDPALSRSVTYKLSRSICPLWPVK